MLYTSHSKISSFPPNPILYPKFYNCEEKIFVLNEGDMLYIPPKWFHWVFSYPNITKERSYNENVAVSFTILDLFNKNVYNEFYFGEPFMITLDKEHHPFLNISFKDIINKPNIKLNCLFTEKKTIVPVQKEKTDKQIFYKNLTINEIRDIYKEGIYNINIGRDNILPDYLNIEIPDIIKTSFLNNKINTYLWVNLFKNKNNYIETGLHYDTTHNVLIQIKGTKVVRLYKPSDSKNMYLQPMYPNNDIK